MTFSIQVRNTTVTADYDTCSTVNIVSYEFAQQQKLNQAPYKAPRLKAFNDTFSNTRGAYYLPLLPPTSEESPRPGPRSVVQSKTSQATLFSLGRQDYTQ